MIKHLKKLTNSGDTIVEVMIVLAVLGLALSISYATANRGLQQSRNAQEHSEALGVIDSQIELLRSVFANQSASSLPAVPFCLAPPAAAQLANPTPLGAGSTGFQESLAADHFNTTAYPVPCQQNTLYNVSIVNRGGGLFDFRVRWDGIGTLGRQQEELTYKIGTIAAGSSGYTEPESQPAPPIPTLAVTLTANNATGTITIVAGTTIALNWSTNPTGAACVGSGNAPSGGFTGVGVPDHGTFSSSTGLADAGKTYTYTLSCSLAGSGSDSQTVIVNVTPYTPSLATLYRSWSNAATDHFYSTSATEAIAPNGAYAAEGTAGKLDTVRGPNEVPFYRLYSTALLDHFYTASASERDLAISIGYSLESTIGYVVPFTGSCPSGTTPLYRMYSYTLTDHFYTTDFQEYTKGKDMAKKGHGGAPSGSYTQPEGITACVFN